MISQFFGPTYRRAQRHVLLACAFFVICGSPIYSDHSLEGNDGVAQVVMLKNGDLLTAVVRRDAHSVFLHYKKGVVTLAREKVACVVNSKVEAYAWKVKRLAAADLDGQFALADWCLNNKALECAAQQIAYLHRLVPNNDPKSPTNRKLKTLDRRLNFLTKIRDGNNGVSPKVAVGTAKLVSHQTVKLAKSDVPQEAVAEFTRQIQPLLLNTCANANCHERVSPGEMLLTRPLRGTVFSKRLTQRNLASVLEHINFVDPAKSNLLSTIEHAHGSAPRAVFGGESKDRMQLAKLKSWIEAATSKQIQSTGPGQVETVASSDTAIGIPSKGTREVLLDTDDQKLTEPISALDELPGSTSADPYDPAAFNDG